MKNTSICDILSLTENLTQKEASAQELQQVLQFWLHECDPTEDSSIDHPSCIHVLGIGLCCAMANAPAVPELQDFSEDECMGAWKDILMVHNKPIAEMHWDELTDTLSSTQMEFHNLFVWAEERFRCYVNMEALLLSLMRRMGYCMRRRIQLRNESEALRSLYDADNEQYSRLRLGVLTDAIDALHAMWTSLCLLLHAQEVPHALGEADCLQAVPLFNHHREASLDSFYEISMVADLAPGAILQYKNKFRVLFHSISQVIYFHYPAYDRQIQKPMHALTCYNASAVNILPLLLQLNPDMPVKYEHTKPTCAAHSHLPWHWTVTAGHVLLIHSTGSAYCSSDIRQLYLLSQSTGEELNSA